MQQYNYGSELAHFGIKGMKWGVRRYQNEDGSLTPAGQKRAKKARRKIGKESAEASKSLFSIKGWKGRPFCRSSFTGW